MIVGGVAEFTGGKGSIWVGSRTAMRGVIAALLLVVAVLAWGLTSEVKKNSQLRGEVEQLTKKLTDKSRLEDLQLQEKCAEQAKKVFNEYKSAPLPNIYLKNPQPRELDTEYQSHYNAKLGKCFMEIKSTILDQQGGDASFNRFLADAYERRVYADYMWTSRKTKNTGKFHQRFANSSHLRRVNRSASPKMNTRHLLPLISNKTRPKRTGTLGNILSECGLKGMARP